MVHVQQQHVLPRVQPQQARAEERPPLQVEGGAGGSLQQPRGLGLALRGGQGGQVAHPQRTPSGGENHLDRLAVAPREDGAQRLVPPHDLATARRSTAASSAPESLAAMGTLYTPAAPPRCSSSHSRSCPDESGSGPARGTGATGAPGEPGPGPTP